MEHLDPTSREQLEQALSNGTGPAREQARARWRAGRYGLCTVCGDTLEADLLLARPDLALCVDCAEDLREARSGQRLGVCGVKPT